MRQGCFLRQRCNVVASRGGADAEKLTKGFDVGAFKQARKVGAAFYIELHKLRQPDVGKILGAQTAKLPRIADEGLQAELVTQKGVFVLQPGKVVVDAVGGKGLGVEQSGLSHEEGFNLKGIVAVLANGLGSMVRAHCSKACALVPKPKFRARVMKNTRSQSPSVRLR